MAELEVSEELSLETKLDDISEFSELKVVPEECVLRDPEFEDELEALEYFSAPELEPEDSPLVGSAVEDLEGS